jgi:hypothetical protein
MDLITGSAIKRRDARLWSTIVILVGLAATSVILPSDSAVGIFSAAAYGVGVTLAGAILIEATNGIRSLIRVDLSCSCRFTASLCLNSFSPNHSSKAWSRRRPPRMEDRRVEGFGQVYLEALARGCPVVGTPHTALPDLRRAASDHSGLDERFDLAHVGRQWLKVLD